MSKSEKWATIIWSTVCIVGAAWMAVHFWGFIEAAKLVGVNILMMMGNNADLSLKFKKR